MMKTAILASLVASAAAFAPAASQGRASTAQAAMADMPGSINFKGDKMVFDPLKLSETYEPFLPFFREAELRHGRTAMLAVVGFIATDFVRIPGDMYSFEAIPKTVDAHTKLIVDGPMVQLLMWVGLWDLIVTGPAISATMKGEREPGDFAWTAFAPKDEAAMAKKVDSELLNGRLAMCAMGGIATQSIMNEAGFPFV